MLKKLTLLVCMLVYLSACNDSQDNEALAQMNKPLETAILDCEDITEKAAKDLVAIVEFQKLEIAGRKSHVFKQCMHDRGFVESADWLAFSQPIASQVAQETKVSVDEALETLRRLHMMRAYGEAKRPAYWMPQS